MCSLPLQKNVGEENFSFHLVPLFRIPQNYVCKLLKEWSSKWRKVFFWANVFSRRRKLFKVAHGRYKITPYVDQRVKEHCCLRNDFGSNSRTFSETNDIAIASFVQLLCLLSFEVCFCRDVPSSFCLVRLCTSASNGIRLKTLLFSCIRILSFCPLFNFLYVLTRAF